MAQDLSSVRDLANADEKISMLIARVVVPAGESKHWFETKEGHIALSVKTHRYGLQINALLTTMCGSARGVWAIPDVDTEVIVGFDEGDVEGDVFVLGIAGHKPPTQITDSDVRLVLIGDEIHAIKEGGTAEALAFKSDVKAISDYNNVQFNTLVGHTHSGGTISGSTGPPVEGGGVGGTPGTCPDPVGTDVLKGQ